MSRDCLLRVHQQPQKFCYKVQQSVEKVDAEVEIGEKFFKHEVLVLIVIIEKTGYVA
jgi:hypothetical protein